MFATPLWQQTCSDSALVPSHSKGRNFPARYFAELAIVSTCNKGNIPLVLACLKLDDTVKHCHAAAGECADLLCILYAIKLQDAESASSTCQTLQLWAGLLLWWFHARRPHTKASTRSARYAPSPMAAAAPVCLQPLCVVVGTVNVQHLLHLLSCVAHRVDA